jgi:steroid delta-isomerase-like uncharacterized protein
MDHEATTRRVYELINAGDIDGFGELLADGMVEHEDVPGFARDRDGVMAFFRSMVAAFPDMRMTPDDVLVDGDKAVARVTTTGTHRGEFMGMPATGRSIDVQVIDIMRYDGDGRVAEHWGVFDALLMMRQLGAIPEPQPAA